MSKQHNLDDAKLGKITGGGGSQHLQPGGPGKDTGGKGVSDAPSELPGPDPDEPIDQDPGSGMGGLQKG